MSGFFGSVSRSSCVHDVFYGTDYHSHLGTKRAGMVVYSPERGFQRAIHSLEEGYFRTKMDLATHVAIKELEGKVVVVGQRTAGAENPVEMLALDDQFVLKIPCYRKIFFGNRSGWEGTGLAPDVEVSADRALETAHLHALHRLQDRLTDAVAREKISGQLTATRPCSNRRAWGWIS